MRCMLQNGYRHDCTVQRTRVKVPPYNSKQRHAPRRESTMSRTTLGLALRSARRIRVRPTARTSLRMPMADLRERE
jgi:hypothetical protein